MNNLLDRLHQKILNNDRLMKEVTESEILALVEAKEKQIPKNWIAEYMGDDDFAWKCPICEKMFMLLDGTPQDNNYNYCPNCGQSMVESK
jgi:rubrerythrin